MLPKISKPIITINVATLKKKFRFRPFLVAEEKLLLMAKESGSPLDIFRAVAQIINVCALDSDFDIYKLPTFELEYIFLKLVSASINNIVSVAYRIEEQLYHFQVDLNTVELFYPKSVPATHKVNDTIGFSLRFPLTTIFTDKEYFDSDAPIFDTAVRSIDKIFDGDEVFDSSMIDKKELEEWVDELPIKDYEYIKSFIASTPRLHHEIKYVSPSGNDGVIVLKTLTDFFTLA